MEQLSQDFPYDEELAPKVFFLCTAESLETLPAVVHPQSANFGLFIAMDAATVSTDAIYTAARTLVKRGLASLCVWGPDCERVHDTFDRAIIELNPDETDANVVITTWLASESLAEAVWFFVYCAFPASAYQQTCSNWIASVICNPEWEKPVREAISAETSKKRFSRERKKSK